HLVHPHPILDTWQRDRQVEAAMPEETQMAEATSAATPEDRFIGVVLAFCGEFDRVVRTANSKAALAALAACQVVVRQAVGRPFAVGRIDDAFFIADSLKLFLGLSGRAAEGGALMKSLHDWSVQRRANAGEREPPDAAGEGGSELTPI